MANPPKGWNLNMTGWVRKLEGAEKAMAMKIMPDMIDKGMDMLSTEVTKNLQGIQHDAGTVSPTPGKLPVSKITSHLANAVAYDRKSPTLGVVFVDKRQAPYGLNVHKGVRKVKKDGGLAWQMKPRKFFQEARRVVRAKLYPVWKEMMSKGLKGI